MSDLFPVSKNDALGLPNSTTKQCRWRDAEGNPCSRAVFTNRSRQRDHEMLSCPLRPQWLKISLELKTLREEIGADEEKVKFWDKVLEQHPPRPGVTTSDVKVQKPDGKFIQLSSARRNRNDALRRLKREKEECKELEERLAAIRAATTGPELSSTASTHTHHHAQLTLSDASDTCLENKGVPFDRVHDVANQQALASRTSPYLTSSEGFPVFTPGTPHSHTTARTFVPGPTHPTFLPQPSFYPTPSETATVPSPRSIASSSLFPETATSPLDEPVFSGHDSPHPFESPSSFATVPNTYQHTHRAFATGPSMDFAGSYAEPGVHASMVAHGPLHGTDVAYEYERPMYAPKSLSPTTAAPFIPTQVDYGHSETVPLQPHLGTQHYHHATPGLEEIDPASSFSAGGIPLAFAPQHRHPVQAIASQIQPPTEYIVDPRTGHTMRWSQDFGTYIPVDHDGNYVANMLHVAVGGSGRRERRARVWKLHGRMMKLLDRLAV
ncbi:hypothetical protein T439DRAFT_323031 [Meredithblackwellia eburnea MCA 4105]